MASEKALAGEGGGNKRQTAKARQAAARKAAAQNAAAQNAAASLGGAIPPSASNLPQPQDSQYESKVYPMDFLNVPGLTPGAGDMDGDGAGRPVGIKRRSQVCMHAVVLLRMIFSHLKPCYRDHPFLEIFVVVWLAGWLRTSSCYVFLSTLVVPVPQFCLVAFSGATASVLVFLSSTFIM